MSNASTDEFKEPIMGMNQGLLGAALLATTLAFGCAHVTEKSAGQSLDDATITTEVKAKFVEDRQVSALDIKVATFKGTVQLSGFATSMSEIERAGEIARGVNGVSSVKNDIRLASR